MKGKVIELKVTICSNKQCKNYNPKADETRIPIYCSPRCKFDDPELVEKIMSYEF